MSMKMMRLLVILFCALLFAGCRRKEQTPVPRPVAYPRVQLADSVYRHIESVADMVNMLANAEAEQVEVKRQPDAVWVDLVYAVYNGAVIHLTVKLLSADKISDAVANRLQRIEMNVGSSATVLNELKNNQFEGIIVKAVNADVTPLQFLATDNKSALVYGSLEMPQGTDVEMALPVVEAVEGDMRRMIESLSL